MMAGKWSSGFRMYMGIWAITFSLRLSILMMESCSSVNLERMGVHWSLGLRTLSMIYEGL